MTQEAAAQHVGPQVEANPPQETLGHVQPVENPEATLAQAVAASGVPGAQTTGEHAPFTQPPSGTDLVSSQAPQIEPSKDIKGTGWYNFRFLKRLKELTRGKRLEEQHAT